ncbi:hypothetical protein CMEL01_04512 [Colletotrichum melonis]|uniref:Peptidase C14 caspase domain-containing protein n=1 Tax=Colletotrichum melonis TaxID=1209925 RepID=A0AAI9XMC1_9PEZI|nr:hypothetical protein CMEL01_04512 [Colletotrichum melonis]
MEILNNMGVGRKRALLIGSQLGNLEATPSDMKTMNEVLQLHGFTITICCNADTHDYVATKQGILDAIDAFTNDTTKGDAVLLYYTGHGGITERANPRNNSDRRRFQYILPLDFPQSRIGDFRGITDLEISQKLGALSKKTDNVTAIIDSCHSTRIARAGAREKSIHPGLYPEIFEHFQSIINHLPFEDDLYSMGNPSVVRIAAAEATEVAYEDEFPFRGARDAISKSILTEALVEALRHSKQFRMSWDKVMLRVKDRVMETSPSQHPSISGPSGRFCFQTEEDRLERGLLVVPDRRPFGSGHILQGGYLHGVEMGDLYAIMPTEAAAIQPELKIADGIVTRVKEQSATIDLRWNKPHTSLPDRGAHAILTQKALPNSRSPVIIQGSGGFVSNLSDAIGRSRFIRVGDNSAEFPTRVAVVEVKDDNISLMDDRGQVVGTFSAAEKSTCDEVTGILEALAKAKRVLGLQGAPPNVWPLLEVTVELGIVQDDGTKHPFTATSRCVEEGQSVYLEVTNSGSRRVHVSVLDLCLQHTTLINSDGTDVSPKESQVIGDTVAGTLKGLEVKWPPGAPRDRSIMVTVVAILTDQHADLRQLDSGFTSHGGMTNRKGDGMDLMEMVDQIVGGGDRPISKIMARAAAAGFGIWTCEYELSPERR